MMGLNKHKINSFRTFLGILSVFLMILGLSFLVSCDSESLEYCAMENSLQKAITYTETHTDFEQDKSDLMVLKQEDLGRGKYRFLLKYFAAGRTERLQLKEIDITLRCNDVLKALRSSEDFECDLAGARGCPQSYVCVAKNEEILINDAGVCQKKKEKKYQKCYSTIPEICNNQDYDPVCGTDNVTYSSKCTACNSDIEGFYEGECEYVRLNESKGFSEEYKMRLFEEKDYEERKRAPSDDNEEYEIYLGDEKYVVEEGDVFVMEGSRIVNLEDR